MGTVVVGPTRHAELGFHHGVTPTRQPGDTRYASPPNPEFVSRAPAGYPSPPMTAATNAIGALTFSRSNRPETRPHTAKQYSSLTPVPVSWPISVGLVTGEDHRDGCIETAVANSVAVEVQRDRCALAETAAVGHRHVRGLRGTCS
jgi:hypothetical protein